MFVFRINISITTIIETEFAQFDSILKISLEVSVKNYLISSDILFAINGHW